MCGSTRTLNSQYFRIRSNIFIDKGLMSLLTFFFGLFGVPNFITKRYLQGLVHLALLLLIIIGILVFRGYFAGMPWGPILLLASYILAFFETKVYNRQIAELKNYATNRSGVDGWERNMGAMKIVDKSVITSICMMIVLSPFIILYGLLFVRNCVRILVEGNSHNLALEGVVLIVIGIAVIVPLLFGVNYCRKYAMGVKKGLPVMDDYIKRQFGLFKFGNFLFWCDCVFIALVIILFLILMFRT